MRSGKGCPATSNVTKDSDQHALLRERYDRLWNEAIGGIRLGSPEQDLVLRSGQPDPRRGLTVIARPPPKVRQVVADFMHELMRLDSNQHYYQRSELHLTVLSLFTATANHHAFMDRAASYAAAVAAAVKEANSFQIEFRGVTASRGAVMIQGFPESEELEGLRERLRFQLRRRGVGEGLDQRYRLESAHMSIARFRSPLREPSGYAGVLENARQQPFGRMRVTTVELVCNDWYMSEDVTKVLRRYRLKPHHG